MIIIEGIDRVGKSTLSKLLSEKLEAPIFHDNNKPPYVNNNCSNNNLIQGFITYKFELLLSSLFINSNVIVDRFHISEKVYNRMRNCDFNDFFDFDKRLSEENAVLILVVPDDIEKSSNEHGSSLKNHNVLFELFFWTSQMKKIKIKQSDIFNNSDKIVSEVLKLCKI